MKKLLKDKTIVFLLPLVIITFLFLYICYNYSMGIYKDIEEKQNNKDIKNFIYALNISTHNTNIKENSYYQEVKKLCENHFDECLIKTTVNSKKLNKERIKIVTYYLNLYLINDLHFFDINNKIILHIKTKSKENIIITSKNSIQIFSSLSIVFLILTIIITNSYQRHILVINDKLEEKVKERTSQISHTIKELEKVNLRLFDLAHTDYLTQIKNRRSFFLHANSLFQNLKKAHKPMSIIMIDIDNFKNFNDTYGHEMGDKVLKLFAKTISNYLSDDAIFGRLGGEEFIIALPYKKIDSTIPIAEDIRKIIENLVIRVPYSELFITASFGVSDSTNAYTIDEIIKSADDMLYDAKSKGKNRVRGRIS
ncbi:diguanylate cyclase [Arcobacter nitrofigilis DSM 7299]|uniref:diguanylate cyclase n=1 Tax=Arcobacter nitrofigilis (strain ATCC 33309 / DSM 7299 / CCUG 15893 / LMG 7604 / NCTC 12251 / CI) TaxID=572480 RepID=D5V2N4_ARCNC|nr:GGDEF domain-containing protein [Arcobacter nitrofigilis]ADG92466.1 diguanylate cyclase [Arcobacter nitrofigilis DSM 7299]